jgi:type I restriction enzyme R subunit
MRHLINTYIQADPADLLGDLSSMSLTELIIETGIHDAMPESSMRRASFQRTPLPRASSTTSAGPSSATS